VDKDLERGVTIFIHVSCRGTAGSVTSLAYYRSAVPLLC
jgi:hypothetical protein